MYSIIGVSMILSLAYFYQRVIMAIIGILGQESHLSAKCIGLDFHGKLYNI